MSASRKDIVAIIKRRNHKEIPLRELEKRPLKNSVMGLRFHLRDMMGGQLLLSTVTTIGKRDLHLSAIVLFQRDWSILGRLLVCYMPDDYFLIFFLTFSSLSFQPGTVLRLPTGNNLST
jgi:hypothetical protein